MSPHSNEHTKTKEGYLIDVEDMLNLHDILPSRFYKLSIQAAQYIYNATLVSGKIGFLESCDEIGISVEGVFQDENMG